jgi:hypothetical protein
MKWLKSKVTRRRPCWRSSTVGARGGTSTSADQEGQGGYNPITSAGAFKAVNLLPDVHTMCLRQAGMLTS